MATPPADKTPPLAPTIDQQELEMVKVVLTARGWNITDARFTDSELIVIASRPRKFRSDPSPSLNDLG